MTDTTAAPPQDIFDVMTTMRAMRRLKSDPIPDAVIAKILRAGLCAPNGGNQQRWRFLVVKDRGIKQEVQRWYQKAYDEQVSRHYATAPTPPGTTKEQQERNHAAVEYLTEHFHEAPVWIVPCIWDPEGTPPERQRVLGASIYPAVQNMLLAARALGLGAVMTTRHLMYERETEAALGLPDGAHSFAIIPVGYPMGRFGPVSRGGAASSACLDAWNTPFNIDDIE